MKTKIYSLDEYSINNASVAAYFSEINCNCSDPKRKRMSRLIKIAFKNELTQRQRDCITLYYTKNKKVTEIAEIMSIKPTTVYKHLHSAIRALKKVVPYL